MSVTYTVETLSGSRQHSWEIGTPAHVPERKPRLERANMSVNLRRLMTCTYG